MTTYSKINKFQFRYSAIICIWILLFLFPFKNYSQKATDVPKVTITVSDIDKILPFYTDVLSFKLLSIEECTLPLHARRMGIEQPDLSIRIANLRLGEETIELMDFLNTEEGDPVPADSRSNDLWFQHIAIVTNDMDVAYARLKEQKVQHVSSAPQTLPDYIPAAAGIKAFYFRDPDGHNLEIIYFPPGKGNPKWQQRTGGPFLGIDHTAIGISDTDASLKFYRDLLGLKVAGSSENFGTEQEHLNQVFGARLMITGLTAGTGIGIEFLEYIAPPGGRKYPEDADTYDLYHWHTAIRVNGLEHIYDQLIQQKYTVKSDGLISIETSEGDFLKACLVKDLDGHAILLME